MSRLRLGSKFDQDIDVTFWTGLPRATEPNSAA